MNDAEKRYLNEVLFRGGEVPICIESDNYPSGFWNEQEKEWQGIAIDVLKEVEKLTGLLFVPVNQIHDDWSVLINMLETGSAALITELGRTDDRQGRFIWPEQPYVSDYYALLSKNDYPDISINEVIYSRVGLIGDTVHDHVFRQWFPHHKAIHEYNTYIEIVEAMEKGTIDLFMANLNLLLWVTNYLERPGFKANLVFNNPHVSYFGFNNNEVLLSSIVSKAQNLVDTKTIGERWTRMVFDYQGKMARAQVPWLAGSLALFMALLVLLLVMLIRKRSEGRRLEIIIHQRTADLEAQTAAAQVASQAKGEFLAHMSHEIRTPLNAIFGMTTIARKYATSEKLISSLDEISTASNHLLGLLNDILDMAKIESGKFALIHEPFSLMEALEEVSEIIKMRLLDKRQQFVAAYKDIPDFTVLGDKLRLKQVLINLLGNSAKFTPEGGRIELRCVLCRTEEKEKFLTFSIIDTGIGMTDEQINKLFTAFEQTDANIAVRFGGTGLGLVISQDLVNQMGGQITVKSKVGEGSVFSFTIGLETTDQEIRSALPEDSAGSIPDLEGKRILLAEDVEINRMILAELLLDTHVEIDEAVDGKEALEKFCASEQGYYDFVFMDVQMPNMDGYEATRKIRQAEQERQAPPVPIFAMTANAYRDDVEKALESGMNGHVAKPIDINVIMRILREHINGIYHN
jgi:signal transduction histidine kinase/ActR/RegA family two-component response regulator